MKTSSPLATTSLALVALFALAATPAHAHHFMDNGLPQTLVQGFLSGLAHPIIGVDHLAFVIGVGLVAFLLARPLVIVPFVLATLLGTGVHLMKWDLPLVEPVIALSVLLVGVFLFSGARLGAASWAMLLGSIGFFHGYAYGESIVGAEQTPLVAYLFGFALIQGAIALTASLVVARLAAVSTTPWARIGGGAVFGVGVSAFMPMLAGLAG